MKARHRKNREAGGGVAEYKEDMAMTPAARDKAPKIEGPAAGRKRGGKAVKMHGKMAAHHAGRKPRKSGGRAGSNMNPLSSAHSGTPAKGRSVKQID